MVYEITLLMLALSLWYIICRSFTDDVKKRAWFITFISCILLSFYGITNFIVFAKSGFDMNQLISDETIRSHIFIHQIFISYMLTDLIVGVIDYSDQFGLVTGWIHHTMYLIICFLFANSKYSALMCLCYMIEVPTAVLSLCKFFPKIDLLKSVFTIIFFIFRICLFSFLMVKCILHGTDPGVLVSMILSVCLNTHWFLKMLKPRNKHID